MTREEAKDFLPILQAFAEGKDIQFQSAIDGRWEDTSDNPGVISMDVKWRIKPEPTYRPFKDAEECWQEMQKHQPFGWIQDKDCNDFKLFVFSIDDDGVMIADYDNAASLESFEVIYLNYTFADGTPFGVRED